ncbi:MAG: hypothetical protein NC428_02100 [Clostridium sp.]|nr:hypothetical protein [Clostridium sp.]
MGLKRTMIKGMMWKEWKQFIGSSAVLIAFYMLVFVSTFYFNIETLLEEGVLDHYALFGICSSLVIFIMCISGCVVISQSISTDKREGILNSLLGTAKSAMYIWMGQLLFGVAVGYLFSMLGLGLLLVTIYLKFQLVIKLSFLLWVELIVVMPVFCAFILSIYSFLLWITKNNFLQMIITILPTLAYIPAIMLSNYINQITDALQVPFVMAAGLIGVLGILAVGFIVNKIPSSVFVSKI